MKLHHLSTYPQGYLRTFLLPVFLFLWAFASVAISAPTNRDYGSLPTISMASTSPSGNLFAYRKVEAEKDLFIIYSRSEKKIISVADVSEFSLQDIYFLGEEKVIVIVSQLKDFKKYTDEFEMSTAYVFDIKNNKFNALLRAGDNIRLGQGGLGKIAGISADKQYLYMPAYVDGRKNTNTPDYSLMKIDIKKPAGPRVTHKGSFKTIKYFMGDKDNILAKETYSDDSDEHIILKKEGNDWVEIYNQKEPIIDVTFVGLTADLQSLVMLDENKNTDRTGYYTLSLKDGKFTETNLGRDDADIDWVIKDPITHVVYGVAYSGFNPSYRLLNPEADKKVNTIVSGFPDQSVWLQSWDSNWDNILVYVEGSDSSGIYYLFSTGKPPVQLAAARPKLNVQDLHPVAVTKIKARDGLTIPTLLTIPNTKLDSMKNLPAVLLPHGGPANYDRIRFDWMAQAFANKGYLVIQPQFRGSTGFGLTHLNAGKGEWGKKMQDDLTDSLQFLVAKGYVDPARVCIVGASYGGYAALAGGAFTPDLYKCVVSINGVSDLTEMLRIEKKEAGKKSWVVSYWEDSIAKGSATKDYLYSVSPSNFVKNFSAPVLLIHGEDDDIVPMYQSELMFKKLKAEKKYVEFKKLKNENHYLQSGETRLEMLESMVGFVEKHLGH